MTKFYFILILIIILFIYFFYHKKENFTSSPSRLQDKKIQTSIINKICYKEPEYFIYKGKEEGPTILIIGATHGNEPAGYFAIKEYIDKLNSQELFLKRGKVIFIPVVNYCGLQLNLRDHNTVGDINRLYNVENKNIINKLIIGFANTSNFIVDFHETHEYSHNSLGSTIVSTETKLAETIANLVIENINKDIIIDYKKFKINKKKSIIGSLRDYCHKLKLNYLLIETSGKHNVQPIEIRVNQCINVINTVLNYFNLYK